MQPLKEKTASTISNLLLAWYDQGKRALPWRNTMDPYHVWISEIMLQQTQVNTVIPYYHRFLEHFPSVGVLARSPLEDVLKVWENLGYYSRARHVHEASKIISRQFGGKMPASWDDLIRLPGIGPYTAGAILSIAFGQLVPAVDGNVRRVLCRLFAVADPIDQSKTQLRLRHLAEKLIPAHAPGSFNQALMELGALICKVSMPACDECPIQHFCLAHLRTCQHRLPVMGKRMKPRHEIATAGILRDDRHRVLIVQRPARGLLGSLWKFPGGFVRPEETLSDGLHRTIREELGLEISETEWALSVKHAYTHFRMTLHAFHCMHDHTEPRALACQDWKWISPHDLTTLPFSRADRKVIASITF